MQRSNAFRTLVGLAAALSSGGCALPSLNDTFAPRSECPLADRGEEAADCPWAQWVRDVESGSRHPSELPDVIVQSLEGDLFDSGVRDAWGLSLNFDSGAKSEIVHTSILAELARRFGVELKSEDGRTRQHAGLIHTYGYLLSNLQTPFGYKRLRWVGGTVDRGLGLPTGTLGPTLLGASSLLSRATYLFMRVATHQDPKTWAKWESRLSPRATSELRALQLPSIERLVEDYRVKAGYRVELVTDLVTLPEDPAGMRLLVYSVRRGNQVLLITGFPVDAKFRERPGNPVRPRYNAWLD